MTRVRAPVREKVSPGAGQWEDAVSPSDVWSIVWVWSTGEVGGEGAGEDVERERSGNDEGEGTTQRV